MIGQLHPIEKRAALVPIVFVRQPKFFGADVVRPLQGGDHRAIGGRQLQEIEPVRSGQASRVVGVSRRIALRTAQIQHHAHRALGVGDGLDAGGHFGLALGEFPAELCHQRVRALLVGLLELSRGVALGTPGGEAGGGGDGECEEEQKFYAQGHGSGTLDFADSAQPNCVWVG